MSDYVSLFDIEYLPKLGVRAPTFRAVMREAVHNNVRFIQETGCIRKIDNWAGDGQSTMLWNSYSLFHDAHAATVDIDEEAITLAMEHCPQVACFVRDSVAYLAEKGPLIDLLYLDSFDLDPKNPGPAAMHCLFEFCAARPRLHKGSIVFIDDTFMTTAGIRGKGMYVYDWFNKIGIQPFTWGYQIAWIMP